MKKVLILLACVLMATAAFADPIQVLSWTADGSGGVLQGQTITSGAITFTAGGGGAVYNTNTAYQTRTWGFNPDWEEAYGYSDPTAYTTIMMGVAGTASIALPEISGQYYTSVTLELEIWRPVSTGTLPNFSTFKVDGTMGATPPPAIVDQDLWIVAGTEAEGFVWGDVVGTIQTYTVTFNNLSAIDELLSGEITFAGGSAGTDIHSITVTATTEVTEVIPEPATMTLLALGGLGLIGYGRKKVRK